MSVITIATMRAAGLTDTEIVRLLEAEEKQKQQCGPVSPSLRMEILARDGPICAYCSTRSGPFHIDHIMPRSRGGKTQPDNLIVACQFCNISKNDRTLEEWRS